MSWIDENDPEAKPRQPDGAIANGPDRPQFHAAAVDELLALAKWILRDDIAKPDFMLGELLSTTTRFELIGPTGRGKTNWLIALGMAVADGRDFLHWRGCGIKRRVLFIDGEISRRQTKRRLMDATRRHGDVPETFFCLNRDDFPDLQPLNSEAGQRFIDQVIEALAIDLVIFDNVQALLSGDMKDEEPWQQTLPWVRDLTRRNVGQIWAHHTGHDESHGYGTKTREWQLDVVALMEEVTRPEADIAFLLKFTKARERSPDNRADFEPAVITLADDTWTSERGNVQPGREKTGADLALDVLIDEIARGNGTTPPACERIPPFIACLNTSLWIKAYKLRSMAETPKAAERAFYRASKNLVEKRKQVGKHDVWVWPVRATSRLTG